MVGRILDAIESLETFPHCNVVERQSKKINQPVRSLPVKWWSGDGEFTWL